MRHGCADLDRRRAGDRARALRKLLGLLRPGGVLAINLRHGPAEAARGMHPVSLSELETLARQLGAVVVRVQPATDAMGRPEVSWTSVALRLSEQNQTMVTSGTHPYGDLPELLEPLKASLADVMRAGTELERELQVAVDDRRGGHTERLTAMRQQWADDPRNVVEELAGTEVRY